MFGSKKSLVRSLDGFLRRSHRSRLNFHDCWRFWASFLGSNLLTRSQEPQKTHPKSVQKTKWSTTTHHQTPQDAQNTAVRQIWTFFYAIFRDFWRLFITDGLEVMTSRGTDIPEYWHPSILTSRDTDIQGYWHFFILLILIITIYLFIYIFYFIFMLFFYLFYFILF